MTERNNKILRMMTPSQGGCNLLIYDMSIPSPANFNIFGDCFLTSPTNFLYAQPLAERRQSLAEFRRVILALPRALAERPKRSLSSAELSLSSAGRSLSYAGRSLSSARRSRGSALNS
jgi:hypothetical protein